MKKKKKNYAFIDRKGFSALLRKFGKYVVFISVLRKKLGVKKERIKKRGVALRTNLKDFSPS